LIALRTVNHRRRDSIENSGRERANTADSAGGADVFIQADFRCASFTM